MIDQKAKWIRINDKPGKNEYAIFKERLSFSGESAFHRAGARKRGLFEKSPLLNSRKNFSATGAGMSTSAPKAARQPFSPRRRRCPQVVRPK